MKITNGDLQVKYDYFPDEIEKLELEPIKKVMHDLGKWPVVEKDWNGDSWTWQKTAKDLILSGFPLNFIFHFDFDVDDKNTSRRVITVRNSY